MTRADVLIEFHEPYEYQIFPGLRRGGMVLDTDGMADEIVRLRGELRDMHTKVFHLEEKLALTERERDQLTSLPAERILAALRAPSEKILLAAVEAVPYGASYAALQRCLPAAVAAAEQEVAP